MHPKLAFKPLLALAIPVHTCFPFLLLLNPCIYHLRIHSLKRILERGFLKQHQNKSRVENSGLAFRFSATLLISFSLCLLEMVGDIQAWSRERPLMQWANWFEKEGASNSGIGQIYFPLSPLNKTCAFHILWKASALIENLTAGKIT